MRLLVLKVLKLPKSDPLVAPDVLGSMPLPEEPIVTPPLVLEPVIFPKRALA